MGPHLLAFLKTTMSIYTCTSSISSEHSASSSSSSSVVLSVALICRFDKYERKKSHIRGKFKYIIVEIKCIKK